jgi:methionyl-tRNA formyltransferase
MLRKPEDGELTSDMSASQVYNMCRALVHPWPGVFYVNPETNQKIIIDTKIDMKKAKDIVKILRSA